MLTQNPYSIIYPMFVFMSIVGLAYLFTSYPPPPIQSSQGRDVRLSPLDGLRGLLAVAVFLCHSAVWYSYIHNGGWGYPGPEVDFGAFRHFGQSSVALFFMITAFLFTNKLLNEKENGVDWTKLYVSRVLRITPLYLLVTFFIIFITLVETNFQIKGSGSDFAISSFKWLTFTVFGDPYINDFPTLTINAGVQWTLVYEWLFYLSLPLLALCLNFKKLSKSWVKPLLLTVALLSVALVLRKAHASETVVENFYFEKILKVLGTSKVFLVGILAAFVYRSDKAKDILSGRFFSVLVILLILWQGWKYAEPSRIPLLCLSISFIVISCGNSLFGILTSKPLRYLGDISYSIYLVHGTILFCIFNYVVGIEYLKTFSVTAYWLLICCSVLPIFLITSMTYKIVELPAMKHVPAVTKKVKSLLKES